MKLRVLLLASLCSSVASATATQALSRRALQATLCGRQRNCRIERVLEAGSNGTEQLAVVRVRSGPAVCRSPRAQGYRDWLVTTERGGVRALRELTRGEIPCLEWQLSEWTYANGELIFHHGGLGAPPSPTTDLRRRHTHVRPWPFAITAEFADTERVSPAPVPTAGPVFLLSMEH